MIFFFLGGVALLALSIFLTLAGSFSELWWVILGNAAFGIASIVRSLFILNEETDCFTNLMARIKDRRKAVNEAAGAEEEDEIQSRVDFVAAIRLAYRTAEDCSPAEARATFVKKLSHAANACNEIVKSNGGDVSQECIHLGEHCGDQFPAFTGLLLGLMTCSGNISAQKHRAYEEFCQRNKRTPLSLSEIEKTDPELTYQALAPAIATLGTLGRRTMLNPAVFREMIEALCLFAFIGDGELHPNEFYIISNLLLSSYDDFPEEFEEFAKLLNG
jgi:hypothetical protein